MTLDTSGDLFDTTAESDSPILLNSIDTEPGLKTTKKFTRKKPTPKVQKKIDDWIASCSKISVPTVDLDQSRDLFSDSQDEPDELSGLEVSPIKRVIWPSLSPKTPRGKSTLTIPKQSTPRGSSIKYHSKSRPRVDSKRKATLHHSPLKTIQTLACSDEDDCIILSPVRAPIRKKRYVHRKEKELKQSPSIVVLSPRRPSPTETPPLSSKNPSTIEESPLSVISPCVKSHRFAVPSPNLPRKVRHRNVGLKSPVPCSSAANRRLSTADSLPPTPPPSFSISQLPTPPKVHLPVIAAEERRAKLQPGAVVRNKADRAVMHASDCPCCVGYYSALDLSPATKQERIEKVSRHRYLDQPLPSTPRHYWELGFPSSQEQRRRGLIKERPGPRKSNKKLF